MIRAAGALAAIMLTAVAAQTDLRIPRAQSAVIDGRADDAEWTSAIQQSARSGLQVRLQHDSTALFISVQAPADGFTSLCLGDSRAVRILHASAALGAVDYALNGSVWAAAQKSFVYSMRNTALTAEAASERRGYFTEHHWVATTVRMGRDRIQEFQIDLKSVAPGAKLALGYYVLAGEGSVLTWPDTLAAADGCGDLTLVRGAVPASLTFDPSKWAALSFAP